MKITKRVLVIALSLALAIGGLSFCAPNKTTADADFAITSPTSGSLKAAGPIEIKWQSASSIGTVSSYDVFVDGKLEKNTTDNYIGSKK